MLHKKLVRSFRCAFQGLYYLGQNERNFRIHLVVLAALIGLLIYCKFSLLESAITILAAGLVLISESVNSGIEILLDIIYPEHNGKSKIIKDVLAGAVLISALTSAIVGILVITFHFR